MFYVTVTDICGSKRGFLAGPYHTHGAALAAVPACERAARKVNRSEAAFAAFGTARVKTPAMRHRVGTPKLNALIGYREDRLP